MTATDESRPAAATPDWERRYRATRLSVPQWGADEPARCVLRSNETGTFELHAWDLATAPAADGGIAAAGPGFRQVTDRPNGTFDAVPSRDGTYVWWFADTDGDEFGTWQRQPFTGGPDEPALPDIPAAYSVGLELGPDGLVVCGCSDDGYGTRIHLIAPDGRSEVVYSHEESAEVGALSHDGRLLAIDHAEHGDARHPAVRVLDLSGPPGTPPAVVGELWDGLGKSTVAAAFAPLVGDKRLLVAHERRGRSELLVWDLDTGTQQELEIELPGELSADWLPDGTGLVVRHEHAARSALFRYELATGALVELGTPIGSIASFAVRPDGQVWFSWSSAAEPPVVLAISATAPGGAAGHASRLLVPAGEPAPASVPAEDVWADGPGGPIHALLRRPRNAAGELLTGPLPVYVDVHGGPTHLDSDEFAAEPAAWVDQGFAVLSVNYRGSTGYGAQWRDALEADVGFTELADIAAVTEHLVRTGIVDPRRCVLGGGSWGGYLTLLGLGTQPERWAAGVAVVPVADYVAAFEDEMEQLKAFDRSLFGGSPTEVPDKYRRASPLTWVDAVRVPVLVLAGANDPRCPIRQIDNYLDALDALGRPHEVYRFDAGHGSLVVTERIRHTAAGLDFVQRVLAAHS